LYKWHVLPSNASNRNIDVFNLGNEDSITVDEIANIIVNEMGLKGVKFKYAGGERGWIGDVPTTILDITKAMGMGWKPSMNSAESVAKSAREILKSIGYGHT